MHIPVEIFWTTLLAVLGWIITSIIKHRSALDHRITYSQCKENRTDCPCKTALEQLQKEKNSK